MAGLTAEELADRLTPEAEELFCAMVEAHLASTSSRRNFLLAGTLQSDFLIFSGGAFERQEVQKFALDDLVSYGLLRMGYGSKGSPHYTVSGESLRFYRALKQLRGKPVDSIEQVVRHLVDGPAFAKAYGSASEHVAEALALLWSDRTDVVTVSDLGGHLRSAVIDTVAGVTGSPVPNVEDIRAQLAAWLKGRTEDREAALLVEVVETAFKLDQRLTHVRDEVGKGAAPPTWNELRRAAFATVFACYELAQVTAT